MIIFSFYWRLISYNFSFIISWSKFGILCESFSLFSIG